MWSRAGVPRGPNGKQAAIRYASNRFGGSAGEVHVYDESGLPIAEKSQSTAAANSGRPNDKIVACKKYAEKVFSLVNSLRGGTRCTSKISLIGLVTIASRRANSV